MLMRKSLFFLALFSLIHIPTMLMAAESSSGFSTDRLWVLLAAALVFMMQAGFLLFEVGSVQPKNATATAMKNLVDWTMVSLAFFLFGFGFMFGTSAYGWIGTDLFFLNGIHAEGTSPLGFEFFMFELAFAATAATIISGAMAERTYFATYLVLSVFVGFIIYPIFGHWAWGNLFIESNNPWLAGLGFIDFAGSTVVHSVGGWISLVGVWTLGPRLGRYDKDGNLKELATTGLAWTAAGVFVLWLGWWGFNGGSELALNDNVGSIIANTNIAAAASGLACFAHCWHFQKRQQITEKFMGGILGGLVAVTACCSVVTMTGALAVGLTAGIIHNISWDFIIKKMKLDDPVGAIPVHLVCGIWGTLCVAIFGQQALLNHPRFVQLGVQAIGILACAIWTVGISIVVLKFLKATTGMRVSPTEELAGLNIGAEFHHVPDEVESIDEDELKALMGDDSEDES